MTTRLIIELFAGFGIGLKWIVFAAAVAVILSLH